MSGGFNAILTQPRCSQLVITADKEMKKPKKGYVQMYAWKINTSHCISINAINVRSTYLLTCIKEFNTERVKHLIFFC